MLSLCLVINTNIIKLVAYRCIDAVDNEHPAGTTVGCLYTHVPCAIPDPSNDVSERGFR
jgi:hypothetical protein